MEAPFKEPAGSASYHEAAELLMAELRESRKRLQHLLRLVHEVTGRDLQARQRPLTRYRCRGAAPARSMAPGA